jgi:orotate phosphoribosyltransferase-like protein
MIQAGMTHQAVADYFNVSRITISRLMIHIRHDHSKLDHGMEIDFLDISVMEQDVIVGFVRINAFHANIDVNDNKQLFWF